MRGLTDVRMPYPIAGFLPALLQEDDLLVRWTEGLDEVLAPVVSTLDCLDAYLDPWLTPPDFLLWLGEWVGAHLDENWPLERQRAMVAAAVATHRLRGTVTGLRTLLELATGGEVEVVDSAGVSWSTSPQPSTTAVPPAGLHVRVRTPEPDRVSRHALAELIRAAAPAHVATTLEVLGP
ncbi:phage tail protein [Micromonospora sp. NBRC 101691]|uniref:phage tail protein n=1 Tax=Micromonospora sp. NBRC 101691 TaxID=3032198 RepID=UPI0024A32016|nr:phage tail protein [Micromonospora sp. NBRC 101691]GLY21864.1 tail protein [Micromonospora sp. NBRC 101691]